MSNHDYQKALEALWTKAVDLYRNGQRDSATYFTPAEEATLAESGITAQELYDFAEDFVSGGDPDFATFIAIHDVKRWFYREVQGGQPTGNTLDPSTLPPKTDSVAGVEWLPRIIPKAKAKLRGELDPDIMYGCGGDRRFFRNNDVHPAEFLRVVANNLDNDQAVIDWVVARRETAPVVVA